MELSLHHWSNHPLRPTATIVNGLVNGSQPGAINWTFEPIYVLLFTPTYCAYDLWLANSLYVLASFSFWIFSCWWRNISTLRRLIGMPLKFVGFSFCTWRVFVFTFRADVASSWGNLVLSIVRLPSTCNTDILHSLPLCSFSMRKTDPLWSCPSRGSPGCALGMSSKNSFRSREFNTTDV